MQTTKKLILFVFLTLIFFYTVPPATAYANGIPFDVTPVIPEDQKEGKGYFNFEVIDDFNQTFYILARNLKDKPITLLFTPLNASTNTYGEISYNINATENQFIDLKVPLSQVITYEKEITIPANSTEKIPLELQLKNVENGTVLGGIHVIAENEVMSEEEVKRGESTFQIKNEIAYVIGVKLQTTTLVDADFSFGDLRVDMKPREPKIFIEMKNTAPAIVKDLNGTYAITDEDGNQVVTGALSKLSMAPNSKFEYAVEWFNEKVEPGTYHVKLSAEADGENVTTERKFVIKETKTVKEHNEVVSKIDSTGSTPWLGYFVTAAIAGLIFFIIGRKSKRKDEK